MPLPAIEQIESSRLTLVPVAASHLDDLMAVNGDDEVTRYLPYSTWCSREDAQSWLARMEAVATAGTGRQLVLVNKADARAIGTLLLFKYEEASHRAELGYVLGRAHWHQGLMREAVLAACDHAFAAMNLRRIEAEVNPDNHASCQLLLDVGFLQEGTLRQRWTAKGSTYDTNIYGLLADDWRRRKIFATAASAEQRQPPGQGR